MANFIAIHLPSVFSLGDGALLEDYPSSYRFHMKAEALLSATQAGQGMPAPDIYGYPLFPFEERLSVVSSTIDPGLVATIFHQHVRHVARVRASRRFLRCSMMVRRLGETTPLLGDVRLFFSQVMVRVKPFWMPWAFPETRDVTKRAPGVLVIEKASIKGIFPHRGRGAQTLLVTGEGNSRTFILLTGLQETKTHVVLLFDAQKALSSLDHLRVMRLCALEGDRLSLKHGQVYTEVSFQVREVLS